MYVPNKKEWKSIFQEIFSKLSERKLPSSSFKSFDSRNSLNFERNEPACNVCFKCQRFWKSSHGFVQIEYRLTLDPESHLGQGNVLLRVFGQKCQRCEGPYAPARFDANSIEHILQKLYTKVGQKFYGDPEEKNSIQGGDLPLEGTEQETGRRKHDSRRCEACRKGKCQSKPKKCLKKITRRKRMDREAKESCLKRSRKAQSHLVHK